MYFFLLIIFTLGALVFGAMFFSTLLGVPFVPTHRAQAKRMMELGRVGPGSRVVDLGSGAGRLLFLAAARGATAVGYELNPFLGWWTRALAAARGLTPKISVRLASLYQADLSQVDTVFCFLFGQPMIRLADKFKRELKPGSRVVSYVFSIPGWKPKFHEQGIYVYEM